MPCIAGEKHRRPVMVVRDAGLVGIGELFQLSPIVRFDPAGGVERGRLEADGDAVLGANTVGQHVELQRADDAEQGLILWQPKPESKRRDIPIDGARNPGTQSLLGRNYGPSKLTFIYTETR